MSFPKGSLGAAALYYASLGWPVFPLVPREKIPLFPKRDGGRGVKDASTDHEQITAWWTSHPDANIGIATGGASALYVVDIDGEAGEAALSRYGALPPCPESHTGKGRHLLFRYPDGRNSAGRLGPKIDTRGEGGYIVGPPSVHPNGHRYRWLTPPNRADVPSLPEVMAAQLTGVIGRIGTEAIAVDGARTSAIEVALNGVSEGGRNQALTEYVGRLLASGLRELEVLELARGLNATKFRPPLDGEEVEAVVRSIAAAHTRNRSATRESSATGESKPPQPMIAVTASVFTDMMTKAQAPVDAMPTMWPSWNRACRMYGGGVGLARGWHVVVAGGAGAGKSLVALNLTAASLRGGHNVGWISLEMSREQLLLRLLGISTGRRMADLEPGAAFDPSAFEMATEDLLERMAMANAGLWMAERPSRNLLEVDRLMRDAVDAGCRLIILDYLQLVAVAGTMKLDDAMRVASSAVQSLAYRYDVTTLALSQFNRSTTSDREAPPSIHGLQGGSAIENDADQVLLLDHTSRKELSFGQKSVNVLLDKNRHGPGAVIPVQFDTNTLRMSEYGPAASREVA